MALGMGMIFLGRRLSADELVAVGADPTLTGDLLRDAGQVDLDQAWGGLHFLLTGTSGDPDFPRRPTRSGPGR